MDELTEFLKNCELFAGLTDFEIQDLIPYFHEKIYPPGEWIIREGEKGEDLYLIERGAAEITKTEAEYGESQILGTLSPGSWFGEMALLEEGERSASVRALAETHVYTVSLSDLKKLENQRAFVHIVGRLAKGISRRLRTADESLVDSLKQKLRIAHIFEEMARLVIQILIFYTIYVNFVKISATYDPNSIFFQILTPIFIGILLISGAYFLFKTRFTLSFFGVNLRNWKKNLLEALAVTIPIMGLELLFKWWVIHYVPVFHNYPLFDLFPGTTSKLEFWVLAMLYLLLIPGQEFIARGILQGCFQEFFQGKRKVLNAILVSNLIFGAAHVVKTLSFAFASFCLGLGWGYLYYRQKSLLGPTISHLLIGAWSFFFLGLQYIAIY